MNGRKIVALYKKEWKGILRDRKSLMAMVLMSFLLYPLLFGIIGTMAKSQAEDAEGRSSRIVVAEQTAQAAPFLELLKAQPQQFELLTESAPDQALSERRADAVLRFTGQGENLHVHVQFDDRYGDSKKASERLQAVADVYKEQTIASRMQALGVPQDVLQPIALQAENISPSLSIVGQFLPYLIAIGLVAGSLQLGVEITAGEKERNTITTLLVSQLSRTEIALGKLLTTLTMGLISVVLNVTSIALGFLILQQVVGEEAGFLSDALNNVDASMIFQLLLIMLPFGFMCSSLIVLLGTFARNSKEGNAYNMPLMVGIMVLGFASGNIDSNASVGLYAVPFMGPLMAMKQVFLSTGNMTGLVIATVSSLVYTVLLILPVVRMYNREEVMFRV